MAVAPSPLPWRAEPYGKMPYGYWRIYCGEPSAVDIADVTHVTLEAAKANADLIVRCVNSHAANEALIAALVAALRMLVGYLRREAHWPVTADHMAYLQDAETALREAEGREGARP